MNRNESDEVYFKYHVSQFNDITVKEQKLWTDGQNRWCLAHHGMSYDKYIAKKEAKLKEKNKLLDEWSMKDNFADGRTFDEDTNSWIWHDDEIIPMNTSLGNDELKMLREDIDSLTDVIKYQGDEVVHLREDLGILFDLVNSMSEHMIILKDAIKCSECGMVGQHKMSCESDYKLKGK